MSKSPLSEYRLGRWPITIGRIEDWLRGWEGTDSDFVPFGVHATRWLLERCKDLDPEVAPPEPTDAPWVATPRKSGGIFRPSPHLSGSENSELDPEIDRAMEHNVDDTGVTSPKSFNMSDLVGQEVEYGVRSEMANRNDQQHRTGGRVDEGSAPEEVERPLDDDTHEEPGADAEEDFFDALFDH